MRFRAAAIFCSFGIFFALFCAALHPLLPQFALFSFVPYMDKFVTHPVVAEEDENDDDGCLHDCTPSHLPRTIDPKPLNYTETTLLRRFCQRVQHGYRGLHTSIAASRRCIIAWKRQVISLLNNYDTLLETYHAKKTKLLT